MSERLTDEEREALIRVHRRAFYKMFNTDPAEFVVGLTRQALAAVPRLAARAGDREGEPMVAVDWPGNPSFLYGWVTMWLEVNRRYLPADQCDLLIAQMDRFYDANGRNREIVEWASRAAPGGETRAEG